MNEQLTRRVIIFDFDGVITDTLDFCLKISQITRPDLTKEEYLSYFEGNINDSSQVKKERNTDFDFFKHYAREIARVSPNEEVANLIKKLSKEYKLFVVSSTNTLPIKDFLKTHNLLGYFEDILGNDIEKSKTKKIKMVLNEADVGPKRAIFITDTLGDVRESNKVDVESIAVTWGYHDHETLKAGEPYSIVDSVRELGKSIKNYFSR